MFSAGYRQSSLILEERTLKTWIEVGDQCEQGYEWANDILTHKMVDVAEGVVERSVVQKPRWSKLLEVGHDKLGHLGHRKVIGVIKKLFTWPGMLRSMLMSVTIVRRPIKVVSGRFPWLRGQNHLSVWLLI